ncbi:Protein of unknown function [Pyronema omphalodes CBS 100304]|uniref:Uncharacterized protein n=1 Tax=Pyronema omphalodes (strain CBS 100304) TaxID=1076935 RepID=U4LEE9_PYROM|nr:Protein of unknown function [Pyronema omphalodes CBS 100304]
MNDYVRGTLLIVTLIICVFMPKCAVNLFDAYNRSRASNTTRGNNPAHMSAPTIFRGHDRDFSVDSKAKTTLRDLYNTFHLKLWLFRSGQFTL